MIDQLFEFIKQNTQKEIVENPNIPNDQNDAVMQEASQSILEGLNSIDPSTLSGLQSAAESGTLDQNDPQVQQITQHFTNNLSNKFGLDNNAIKALAIALIPVLLKKLLGNKNAHAQVQNGGGLNLESILGSLLGGGQSSVDNTRVNNNGNLMDKLSDIGSKLGLDKDGDGKVGLNDFLGK